MKMLTCQLNSIGWLQMNAPLPRGWGCIQAETGSPTALHINEWCTADKMQINLSSGQQAHSRKKPCSLLEAHHPPCPHSPNACHFFKKISNKGLASAKKPVSYRGGTLTFPSSYQIIFPEDRISSKELDVTNGSPAALPMQQTCDLSWPIRVISTGAELICGASPGQDSMVTG